MVYIFFLFFPFSLLGGLLQTSPAAVPMQSVAPTRMWRRDRAHHPAKTVKQ